MESHSSGCFPNMQFLERHPVVFFGSFPPGPHRRLWVRWNPGFFHVNFCRLPEFCGCTTGAFLTVFFPHQKGRSLGWDVADGPMVQVIVTTGSGFFFPGIYDGNLQATYLEGFYIWVFPKIGVYIPKMDGLWWKTLLKWMIWGYHSFRKHPYPFTS